MKAIKLLFSVLCAYALMHAVLAQAQSQASQHRGYAIAVAPQARPPAAAPYWGPATVPFGVGQSIGGPVQQMIPGPHLIPGFPVPVQPFFNTPVQPFLNAPVQPFFNAPVQPFGGAFPPTRAPYVVRPHDQGRRHGSQIIVPRGPSNVIVVQGPNQFVTHQPDGRRVRQLPPIGTPRDQVILLLGKPSVTMFKQDGETLFYSDGLSVFIQNGQMAGPK
jgi:hypothetical protein